MSETSTFSNGGATPLPPLTSPLPSDHPTPPNAQLGSFRLGALLGAGGMGLVYRAEDLKLGREVALKVMRPELAGSPEARQRFLREARAAAAVLHDHIMPIYQVGEDNGAAYFAMPLLAGESLQDRINREPRLPISEVLRIGRETAEGLAAAHAARLIHRDIKPANIWLETGRGEHGTGRVKILDFGLVQTVEGGEKLTQAVFILGSPGYMSPEQIDALAVDARTDLFSLGCVLYQLATGERAFSGNRVSAVLRATVERDPAPVQQLQPQAPPALSSLIAQLLAKRADDRPANAELVAQRLREIERQGAAATAPLLPRKPVREPGRASRRWQPAALSLAVLLLLGGGWAWWARSQNSASPKAQTIDLAPLTASLDVRVWKKHAPQKGQALGDAETLPLKAGDWMRIEARASRSAYLYLVYLDATGKASPLFPWRKYDWKDRPAEEARTELNVPDDPRQDGAPLEKGPSGIESVLLLVREAPLTQHDNERLAKTLGDAPRQGRFDPLRGAVWLGEDQERFGVPSDRGRPELDKAGEIPDPVERLRRLLRTDVATLADVRRGVCYPFAGE